MLGDQSLHYMTTDELKALADDNTLGIDVTRDEKGTDSMLIAPLTAEEDHLTPQHVAHQEATFTSTMAPDNVDISRAPVHAGFLVSFMVDARGGAMRGCRHSGVRVIIPPRRAPMPMRITCRYLRKEKLAYPPPLMEGEACASRILEVGPSGAKFLGPVIIEVPHFASLRGREREITILRSDNGESWREHTLEASDDAVHDVFNESFEGEELTAREDLSTDRITRILTTDFPQYFAIITRIRQEVHVIGPEGGMVSSTVVPQVQAIFPEGALTKKIKVGLQAQPITPELVTKLLGNRVAVSPILTVEPRRRKFHKPITLTIPVPQAATKGMINQYSGDAPTLRLLCSITGGTTKAQWEDVTGSTPLTFVNDCVSFTTTVSARFWLIDCRQVNEATKFATELYREAIHVPFMAKFVVFAKRHDPLEAQLRVFCMTDDKEDKTLESQEHFTEVAKSRDVEVLEGKLQYLEFAGNLVPVTKSGEQLSLTFQAFRENRLPFTIRVKDPHQEPMGRVAFMREPRVGRGEPPQSPICNLNIVLPEADLTPVSELVTLEKKYGFVRETSLAKPELIHRADLRLSDIAKELKEDWVLLALQLDLSESDINAVRSDNPNDSTQQALAMLRQWVQKAGNKSTGNFLEKGLRKINREDIINNCMFNVELVTDDVEKAVAKVHLDQSGFDTFKEELGSSRDASLRRETSLNGTYDEQDIMKDAESAAETSSESSDKDSHSRGDKHPDARKERKIVSETVVSTSAKVLQGTPDTLVQGVPSAFSEVYARNMNGQMSDASMHEEDHSEPTVATLSSEATGEMDVSSLDDKSQTDTHVEKRAQQKCAGSTYFSGKLPSTDNCKIKAKETLRNVKLYKQMKKSSYHCSNKRKTISDFYSRAETPPASFKRKKPLLRRNSWPPVSPLKLTKRKKYHELIKVKDFQEPFWMDTFDWLTMKCAPEKFIKVPLAKLSEFVEFDAENERNFSSSGIFYNSDRIASNDEFLSNKMTFYCILNAKQKRIIEKKKYLQNLKAKCFVDSVRSLKPTNFDSLPTNDSAKVENDLQPKMEKQQNCVVSHELPPLSINTNQNISSDRVSFYDINEEDLEDENGFTHEAQRSNLIPLNRFVRPLQSFNGFDSQSSVLIHNIMPNFESHSLKQKIYVKENHRNKENIKVNNYGFPNAKYPDHIEKPKKHSSGPLLKRVQKPVPTSEPIKEKYNLPDKFIVNDYIAGKETFGLPKDVSGKSSQQEPQDMVEPDETKPSKSGQSESKPSTGSSGTSKSSTASSDYQTGGSSNSGQNNKPYLRHLFEQDIQSNFAMSSKVQPGDKEDKTESDKNKKGQDNITKEEKPDKERKKECEESKKPDIPASVVSQTFLSSLIEQSKTSSKPCIPASVIGQSFLKTLEEQTSIVKDKPIPAEVIGQSFIKNLLTNQNIFELPDATKSLPEPSEKTSQSEDTKAAKTVLPASAIGQTFLKALVDSQSYTQSDESNLPSTSSEQPQAIPAAVISQEFLKILCQETGQPESKSADPKIIPASVVSQSFLKSLSEQSQVSQESEKEQVIPSSVIGQAFMKTLMEEAPVPLEAPKEQIIPSSVLGQAFLKTLLDEAPLPQELPKEQVIPSSVVGQAFLKTLIGETSLPEEPSKEQVIPSSVVGQAFLKTLMEEAPLPQESPKEQVIPSSVVGQAFLKTLIGEAPVPQESTKENVIPSSVVGQAFLKTLIGETPVSQELPKEQVIPSSVVGQAFLKTLMEEAPLPKESPKEQVIPSSVVGQAFLKTLIGEAPVPQESTKENVIPSSVVGQAFLKTLIGETPVSQELPKEQVIPSSVVGQAFLKTLMGEAPVTQESTKEQVIPSSVVGQTFLKALIGEAPVPEESAKEQVIPSSVVGQAFLKTLLEEKPESQEVPSEQVIPSSIVGQAFLKTLLEQAPQSQETPKEKIIPSSVVSQAFLKTLSEQASESQEITKEQVIPSSVVGQAFLKSLISTSASDPKSSVTTPVTMELSISKTDIKQENIIPASVVGQSFLSSLLSQSQASVSEKDPVPASVVGLTFLKSLSEQAKTIGESASPVASNLAQQTESKSIPASVVGQAFLKTLFSISEETKEAGESSDTKLFTGTCMDVKRTDSSGENGCSNGCSPLDDSFQPSVLNEEQSIIPPPPEFSGEIGESSSISPITSEVASSSKADLSSSIIQELLSCTKVMQSVIESMKEPEPAQTEPETVSSADVCTKDKDL